MLNTTLNTDIAALPTQPRIICRSFSAENTSSLIAAGAHPVLAKLYAARGLTQASDLDLSLNALLPFQLLKGISAAVARLQQAIALQELILIVADYDADGATACAVAMKGLKALGARVHFVVPNRFEYGYGLSPEIVDLAAQFQPQLIVTVDNGIASVAGVARAQALGIDVLVTDHHLPGDVVPDCIIVNPNQKGCDFPSKNLAGVGVMFYVLMALRHAQREAGLYDAQPQPNLAVLLDLVALGTVADLVKLDKNNRILVEQGLRRIRAGKICAGMAALFEVAKKSPQKARSVDFGFSLGPRLNAAGRLDDMSLGIACLLSETPQQALDLAHELDELNRERRQIESVMKEEALQSLETLAANLEAANLTNNAQQMAYSISLFHPDWHQGVVGIVASRVKELHHRPCFIFAPVADSQEIRGSGRSIEGFHLRDALDLLSKRHPALILKFGGHAMAAGLSLRAQDFEFFQREFEAVAASLLTVDSLTRSVHIDGSLSAQHLNLKTATLLNETVWGQGFLPPLFQDAFEVVNQKRVGTNHLKATLRKEGIEFEAMCFNRTDFFPLSIKAVYQMVANEWRGGVELQLYLEQVEAA